MQCTCSGLWMTSSFKLGSSSNKELIDYIVFLNKMLHTHWTVGGVPWEWEGDACSLHTQMFFTFFQDWTLICVTSGLMRHFSTYKSKTVMKTNHFICDLNLHLSQPTLGEEPGN